MTLTEARQILNAKPEFGSKPNPKLHRQAIEVVDDWEEFVKLPARRANEDHSDTVRRMFLLRKHPSFAREK